MGQRVPVQQIVVPIDDLITDEDRNKFFSAVLEGKLDQVNT